MIFSWQILQMMKAAEAGFKLKSKIDKIKKNYYVAPYQIPEHLKPKTK